MDQPGAWHGQQDVAGKARWVSPVCGTGQLKQRSAIPKLTTLAQSYSRSSEMAGPTSLASICKHGPACCQGRLREKLAMHREHLCGLPEQPGGKSKAWQHRLEAAHE